MISSNIGEPEPILNLKDLFSNKEDKINKVQYIQEFPQKAKIDNFKLLKDIQTVLQKCFNLSEQQKIMYCQSQRYFMKLYLREINKRM